MASQRLAKGRLDIVLAATRYQVNPATDRCCHCSRILFAKPCKNLGIREVELVLLDADAACIHNQTISLAIKRDLDATIQKNAPTILQS
jgi:hypothetical protein